MAKTTHTSERLTWIEDQFSSIGITEYRFCIENDCYVCDIYGNFYSVCTRQLSKSGNLVEKYNISKLKGSIDKYGYLTYRMVVQGKKSHIKAHRAMLNAWIGCNENLVVNHRDGNKINNRLSNLEWCTVAQNNAHALASGLFDPHHLKGKLRKIPSVDWMTVYILHKHCGYSLSELGRMNCCSHDTIKNVIMKIDRIIPKEVQNAG